MLKQLRNHPLLHFFFLGLGVLCISWSAIFVKLSGVPGLSTAFYRMAIGFIGVLPLWYLNRKSQVNWKGVKLAVVCGALFAIDISLWNTAIVISKASISTLLANLAPVWVGIAALFFWKQKPTLYFWLGTVISILGVAIILGLDQILATRLNSGNLLSILASMFYGAYMFVTQKGRAYIDTLTFSVVSMGTSAFILLAGCLVLQSPIWGFEAYSWWALIGVGIIPQLIGWLSINFALKFIKPTTASVSLLSQSVFTALFSVPVLGEFLSLYEALGALVVLCGIYLVNKKS
jgi:drug/metabolite transporter (DMT)-like permease